MRTSSALFVITATVALASLVAIVWYGRADVVEAGREDKTDLVESPAEKRDQARPSAPAETVPDETLPGDSGDVSPTQSIRALIGVSIEWKKWSASSNPQALRDFHAAIADFNAAELVRLAKEQHESRAAAELGVRKALCQNAPTTREALKAEMEALEQSGIAGFTPTDGHQLVSDDEVQMRIQMMQTAFEQCSQIRTALDGDDTNFMKLAADLGNPLAMVDHGRSILRDDADLAKSYFYRSWDAGEATALLFLSNFENSRFEEGIDPSADVESVALFAAYAAVEEAKIELLDADPSHPVAQALAETGIDARNRLNALLPHKRDLAIARARELIVSNDRCCIGVGGS